MMELNILVWIDSSGKNGLLHMSLGTGDSKAVLRGRDITGKVLACVE